VSAAFQPKTGALWSFYDSSLQNLLLRQGGNFVDRAGDAFNVDSRFLSFFNAAADVSDALFDQNDGSLGVVFSMTAQLSDAVTEVAVNIEGQAHTFTRTNPSSHTFEWRGSGSTGSRIDARAGAMLNAAEAPAGPWSIFRLFEKARLEQRGSTLTATWQIPGSTTVSVDVVFAKGQAVFRPNFFGALGSCPGTIVR
jgi:type VI secretion system protein ImpL